jgi:hypothetical protein
MKILNYVELIDSVRSNRTELYTKKHKNNQKIRKSSGTVRRDKIELVRLSSVRFDSVRFENLLKFDSFTVMRAYIYAHINIYYRCRSHFFLFNTVCYLENMHACKHVK